MSSDPIEADLPAVPDSAPPVVTVDGDVSRVTVRVELAPGAVVEIQVETRAPDGALLEERSLRFSNPAAPHGAGSPARAPLMRGWVLRLFGWAHSVRWPAWLFAAALIIYLITRLVSLADFPIYFFTDEAVQAVRAADLVRDQFRGYSKEFLPTFFPNGNQYNLSISVYLQVLPVLLFERSVWVTRGVATLMTLLAAFAVGRILRDIYASPYAWAAILLLGTSPAWFLHSRTAFETALAASFYAGFLWFYLRYRCQSPRNLYGAVALGALAFYTYSPMQLIMAVTALLLLISDARYHWQQRKTILRGFGLALLLALPYARFLINHPAENSRHLEILSSYWVQDLTLGQKLARFGAEYLKGLNPLYWFAANDHDFTRHRMGTFAHMLRLTLPLAVTGLILALLKIRAPQNRAVLAALFAAPTGAALVGVGITRLLVMIIPLTLLAALGLDALLGWLEKHFRLPRPALGLVTFGLLAVISFYQLNDALVNGPTWFRDYGLGGMQYGARQVFAAVEQESAAHPERTYLLSPSWTNGTEEVARFFAGDDRPFRLGSISGYLQEFRPELESTTFVMIPEELAQAAQSGKVADVTLERVLFFPDGTPGFYFVRLRYADTFAARLESEVQNRRVLREDTLAWDGAETQVRYPTLDMGQIADAFDGDQQTILRTLEANPLRLDIRPAAPRAVRQAQVRVGGNPTQLTLRVWPRGADHPRVYSQELSETTQPRVVTFQFGQEVSLERLEVEVYSIGAEEPAHVHLWEVSVK